MIRYDDFNKYAIRIKNLIHTQHKLLTIDKYLSNLNQKVYYNVGFTEPALKFWRPISRSVGGILPMGGMIRQLNI